MNMIENENKTVYLSLGTNLNNKKQNLINAYQELIKSNIHIIKTSSIYETEPIGLKEQPVFYNMAVKAETSYSPAELLEMILNMEIRMVRERDVKGGPRIIDIDILLYEQMIVEKKDLIIPHPEMHKRNFVLAPLEEIDPDLIHPKLNKELKSFIQENKEKVEKIYEFNIGGK